MLGDLDDTDFDALLAPELRELSRIHFTPAAVGRRAAELLVAAPNARVLDVGAAVGKFCIIAATTIPEATFVGIERRGHLAEVAIALVQRLAIPNAHVLHGDATTLDWSSFDAFYLYNPFGEHLRDGTPALDERIELDPAHYYNYVRFVRQQLAAAAVGTRLVTYHGFGGRPPPSYVLTEKEPMGTDYLELWIKAEAVARSRRPPRV